jgi:hypothetical protein
MEDRSSNLHSQTGDGSSKPLSYQPISLFDTINKLLEKILRARILYEVGEHGLMRDEELGFRTRRSTSLQLA